MTSPKFSFSGTSVKILKSLMYCLLGALATWLVTLNDVADFGQLAPFVGALAPLVANMISEYVKERK